MFVKRKAAAEGCFSDLMYFIDISAVSTVVCSQARMLIQKHFILMEMKTLNIVDRCCLVNKDFLDVAQSLVCCADGDVLF